MNFLLYLLQCLFASALLVLGTPYMVDALWPWIESPWVPFAFIGVVGLAFSMLTYFRVGTRQKPTKAPPYYVFGDREQG